MSRKNAVKIKTLIAESSGYHFKSATDHTSYVIASKHGLCHKSINCEPYNNGDSECCKGCDVQPELTSVSLSKDSNVLLTAKKVYSFPNNDIAIIQVEEQSSTPLKIGRLEDGKGESSVFGF